MSAQVVPMVTHSAAPKFNPEASWERVRSELRASLGEATWQSWIKPVSLIEADIHNVTLGVPTRFMREWVASHYGEQLREAWARETPQLLSLNMIVRSQPAAQTEGAAVASASKPAAKAPLLAPLPESSLDSRFTFEQFVVGSSNEFAYAAARRVAESTGTVEGLNPLFLHGGVGLGKTHLMHAIAWHLRRNQPERRVLYLSAEQFMVRFIRALRDKEAVAFKEQFRSVDVLMIDDVQFICGKETTQEEFFHTFNALVDQGKQLIISGDRAPSDLEGMEERVRSRLIGGLVVDIRPTTFELRLGILRAKLAQLPFITVPDEVVSFLAQKITSNIRELEGALNRIVAHATLVGRDITLDMVQDALRDLLRANDRRISIADIQKEVAGYYSIRMADMQSARRSRCVARPRQVAMYLAKRLTNKSLPEIGRKFGGKDHTTVMHAVRRIEALVAEDSELADDVALLSRSLRS